ncbi:hypothetical protein SHELI_v1c08810 [Spiroplasma helicoides]|uniref:Uncharacterized protein n=1 Tax=Spiroplasma helicoides TaxID=216938 RepID=A0A1B3SLQ3_9MOLU|nr:hypothetical protein [Spiroplasma helicoides]AOG60830.1 hypothetical protein SHELI_v1c08810 [Spiroplasma helicoides]
MENKQCLVTKNNHYEVLTVIIFLTYFLVIMSLTIFLISYSLSFNFNNSTISDNARFYVMLINIVFIIGFTSFMLRGYAPEKLRYVFWLHNMLFFLTIYWEYLYWKYKKVYCKRSYEILNFIDNALLTLNIFLFINFAILSFNDVTYKVNFFAKTIKNGSPISDASRFYCEFLLVIINCILIIPTFFGWIYLVITRYVRINNKYLNWAFLCLTGLSIISYTYSKNTFLPILGDVTNQKTTKNLNISLLSFTILLVVTFVPLGLFI